MNIDTDALREAIADYYADRSNAAEQIQNDRTAIAQLTRLEAAQLRDEHALDDLIAMAERFAPAVTTPN